MSRRTRASRALFGIAFALVSASAFAQETPAAPADPALDRNPLGQNIVEAFRQAGEPENISTSLLIVFLLTILTLAPAILVMTTSFTRIIVVFGFLRQAMATQQSPPNQVLIGLALFLTFFIMAPTYQRMYDEAVQPYIRGEIPTINEAYTKALVPMREFMFRQLENNPRDIALFMQVAKLERPQTRDDIPTTVLVPAFILNEMRISFQMGFIIYVPFLIIDMVVASTLMAMGMMMLPPVFVSLPFKIIMFVLADGWMLLIGSLVRSFG